MKIYDNNFRRAFKDKPMDLKSIFESYSDESIEIRETPADVVRNHTTMFMPTQPIANYIHIIRELLDNSDDEAASISSVIPEAANIHITFREDNKEFTIIDNGRGFPHGTMRDVCERLHASGKYSKNSKTSGYRIAGGMHGVGLKLAVYQSEEMEIISYRENIKKRLLYIDGKLAKETEEPIKKSDKQYGTIIRFLPSDKYLKGLNKLTHKHVLRMIEEKADAFPGVTKHVTVITKSGKEIKEKYVGLDIMGLMNKYNKVTTHIWNTEGTRNTKTDPDYLNFKVAFGYDEKMTEITESTWKGWCNFIHNFDGGTHVDGVINAIESFVRKNKSIFSEKERKDLTIKKEDIKLGLCFVIVAEMKDPDFKGQYKQELTSDDVSEFIEEKMTKYLNSLPDKEVKIIGDIIKNNIKARLASQRARQTVKKVSSNLSSDRIERYITVPISYSGEVKEVMITEGESAGEQARMARLSFQEVYKLRGRIDNIMDVSIADLSKISFIADMSRITGLVPGKRGGTPRHEMYGILTDADPDGRSIRVGITVAIYKAFPEIIEKGLLYVVLPPAYSFTVGGKTQFVSSNREYFEFIKDKFIKDNTLYFGDDKYSSKDLVHFIEKNERYLEKLKKLANFMCVDYHLAELIVAFGTDISKGSVKKWDSYIKKAYSKDVNVTWSDDENCIIIDGMRESECVIIHLDNELIHSKKYNAFKDLVVKNYNNVFGYSIKGVVNETNLSIYDVMMILDGYKGKNLQRYKGLGEMSKDDLRNTCLDPKKRQLVQITMHDVEEGLKSMINWYSSSTTEYRKEYMMEYVYDILEIDT